MKKHRKLLTKRIKFVADEYDRLNEINKEVDDDNYFTNKAKFKKVEFDYEEDPYEPDIGIDEFGNEY